jgi:hypothetical protein
MAGQASFTKVPSVPDHPLGSIFLNLVDNVPEIQAIVDEWHQLVYARAGDVKPGPEAMAVLMEYRKTLGFKRLVSMVQGVLEAGEKEAARYPSGVKAAEYAPSGRGYKSAVEVATIKDGKVVCKNDNVVTVDCLLNKDCDWLAQDKNQLHIVVNDTAARGKNPKGVWTDDKVDPAGWLYAKHGPYKYYGLLRRRNRVRFGGRMIAEHSPNAPRYERYGEFAGGAFHKGLITPKLDGRAMFLRCEDGKAMLMLRGGGTYLGVCDVDCKIGFEQMDDGDLYLTWVKSYATIPNLWGFSMQEVVAGMLTIEVAGKEWTVKLPPVLGKDCSCVLPNDGIVVHVDRGYQYFYKRVNTCDLDKKTMQLVQEHLFSPSETGEAGVWDVDEVPGPGIWEYEIYPDALKLAKVVKDGITVPKRRLDKDRPNALHNVLKSVHSMTVDEYVNRLA